MTTPTLGVIIPCKNEAELLPVQLAALASQDFDRPWELVVVDNGSTDDTADVARGFADRIANLRVIEAPRGGGMAAPRNAGVRAVRASRLVFLDADDQVAPNYLSVIDAALDRHAFVAARLDVEKLNPGWIARTRTVEQTTGLGSVGDFLPWAQGGSIACRREVYDAAGGFNEGIPSGDDIEFCWEAQLAGIPLIYLPDAVVHYRFRSEPMALFRQGRRFGRSAVLRYVRFRERGLHRSSPVEVASLWASAAARSLLVFSPLQRARAALKFGLCLGRLEASIHHRVLHP
jgi:glycosyltransferase involved in cell wall biosynthesis